MTRPRDVFGVSSLRKTFNCLVVGASGSGKSVFMDAFIMAKSSSEESKESVVQQTTANISKSDAAQLLRGSARLN